MSKIGIWMFPEAGHTIPSIKVAEDLRKRGHQVVYIAGGGIGKELADLGFETYEFLSDDWPEAAQRSIFQPCPSGLGFEHQLIARFGSYESSSLAIRDHLVSQAESLKLDLFLFDGIHSYGLYQSIEMVCKAVGLFPQLPYTGTPAQAWRVPRVYLCPMEFELPEFRQSEAFYTEPALWFPPKHSGLGNTLLGGEEHFVYCSLGTQARSYPTAERTFSNILTAAQRLPEFRFLIELGGSKVKASRLPGNVRLIDFIRHADALPYASLAIIHGGLGVIKDCIHFRVPMLVLPQRWDQPDNAVRVMRNQLGLTIPPPFQPDKIALAVRALISNKDIAERILYMNGVFARCDLEQRTASVCERLLEQSR